MDHEAERMVIVFGVVAMVAVILWRPRRRASGTAFGTAQWASERILRREGMLGRKGLILGRTANGRVIRLAEYCHLLLVGTPGSGKGVSFVLPQLLTYRGSLACFDTKSDLSSITAARRAEMGHRVIRLAPFQGGTDCLNPLDIIPGDSPTLIDDARVLAEALVVRKGTEPDPHWCDKAAQIICALLVLVLLRFDDDERNLSSVQEMASDPKLLSAAADMLRALGGIPARLGNQIGALFTGEELTKEGASVMSHVQRTLAFLDSPVVAASLAHSTFDLRELVDGKRKVSLFFGLPPERLESHRGLLRCWLSTMIRVLGNSGDERKGEVLFLLDEFSAIGSSLPAIEEALVRGRSAGARLVIACQSDSQVRAAFPDKPTLLYDNCSTQIYLRATSIETAERISKSMGDWTQVVESGGTGDSMSRPEAGAGFQGSGRQFSQSSNQNWQVQGRALLRPEEILTMSKDHLIALVAGMPPIWARRVKYFADPLFTRRSWGRRFRSCVWWCLMIAAVASVAWAAFGG